MYNGSVALVTRVTANNRSHRSIVLLSLRTQRTLTFVSGLTLYTESGCPSGVPSSLSFRNHGNIRIKETLWPAPHIPSGAELGIVPRTKIKKVLLTSFQAHPSKPPAVDFFDTATS